VTPLLIGAELLEEARAFFEDCGSVGCEGTAMIAARASTSTRIVVPDQRATPAPHCSVEVTLAGKLQLASALDADERYVSRIHSHPGLAFHSPIDNANPAITHDGALSIVAPYFGLGLRHGLAACAVLVLRDGRWIDLPPGPRRDAHLTS
jgi:hypothetical protein